MSRPLNNDSNKINVLRLVNEGLTYIEIEQRTGIPRSTINDFVKKKTHKKWWEKNNKPIADGQYYDHHQNIKKLKNKCFILTSAQNNTYVHDNFLASLEVMAEERNAKIIVGTFSYNTNGFQNLENGEGWFDPKIEEYIIDEPLKLADDLIWCGELNILPTAVNPLSGFHSYTKDSSGIIPHAKVQLESLPSPKSKSTRMLYTTGAVTKRNYIQKKAGQKASFHHIFGALIVEIDSDGDWFVRQLIAESDTGEFYDLNKKYTPDGIIHGERVEAVQWGDIHVEKLDSYVCGTNWFNQDSIMDVLRPKYQFIHDMYDAYYRNHHHAKNYFKRFELFTLNKESVADELNNVLEFLKHIESDDCETVIVNSNHDRALDRWLNEADYRTDHVNAIFFLELQFERYKNVYKNKEICLLEEALRILNDDDYLNCKFLKEDESFVICDEIECGMHGDVGISGSRGSANAFTKLGTKVNVGHSHSAKIIDGVYQAGHCMDLSKVDYTRGPSTWSHSHIITYKNGKRTIVTIKNGKWRA